MKQRDAKFRVCASCEWVFLLPAPDGCPKCGFAHYGARYVYGTKAYQYIKNQRPWIDRKMNGYFFELLKELPIVKNKITFFIRKKIKKVDKSKRLNYYNYHWPPE